MVNFVVLLTKQLLCNLLNFISKSSSFLWLGCLQRAEWMEDRWGGKPWCTPECCSSDEELMVAFTVNSPCLTGCAARGEAAWVWLVPVPVPAPGGSFFLGQCMPAVSLPCSGAVLGGGSLLGVVAQLWLQTLSVSQALAAHARAMVVEDV